MNQKGPKKYEDLVLSDDFMFGRVMSNKKLCKRLLELVLDMEIEEITYPELQKSINLTYQGKSVRLDVYAEDRRQAVYNAEMQNSGSIELNEQLPKRSRYYQGMIDLNLIEKGADYQELNESYIIFLCTFDPFGEGRYKYTFQNICVENKERILEDKATRVFLNTKGSGEGMSKELAALFTYLNTQVATDEFTRELDEEVKKIRQQKKWRREYMKTYVRDIDMRTEGRLEAKMDDIRNLMSSMKWSSEQAMKALGVPKEKYASYKEMLGLKEH